MTNLNALFVAGCVAFTASTAISAPCDKQKTASACGSKGTTATLASMPAAGEQGWSCNGSKAKTASQGSSCNATKARMASMPVMAGQGSSCGATKAKMASMPGVGQGSSCGSKTQKAAMAWGSCGSKAQQASLASTSGPDIVDTAVAAGSFNTLAAALDAAGLVSALKGDGPFTVFAPTDEAFSHLPYGTVQELLKPQNKALLTAILTYHVVPGAVTAEQVVTLTTASTLNGQQVDISVNDSGVMIDGAKVIKADIACRNGVIHVIDRVIMPSTDDLIETAVKAGSFETLAAAVKTAGLAGVLSGDQTFTIFAPTDAAFAKLPAGTVETLLKPEQRDTLIDILKYHVVPGRVYARDALSAQTAETVEGSRLRFALAGNLRVNDANVINADLETSNGVIHVIDQVLIP